MFLICHNPLDETNKDEYNNNSGADFGFWEMNLNIYDIAAGALIVREAGGNISDFSNAAHYPEQGIVAANSYLHPLLIKLLRKDNA